MLKPQVARLVILGLVAAAAGAAAQPEPAAEKAPELLFDAQPVTLEGRCLVPMRSIAEWLGAKVVYKGGRIQAFRSAESVVPQVELWVGSTDARVSGAPYELDVPPQVIAGRTFVPLRFVAESFGVWVKAKGRQMILSLPQEELEAVLAIPPHPQAHLGKIWRVVERWYDVVPPEGDSDHPHWDLHSQERQNELLKELGAQAPSVIEAHWGARGVNGIRILDGRVAPRAEDGWVEVLVHDGDGAVKERLEFVREPAGWRVAQVVKQ